MIDIEGWEKVLAIIDEYNEGKHDTFIQYINIISVNLEFSHSVNFGLCLQYMHNLPNLPKYRGKTIPKTIVLPCDIPNLPIKLGIIFTESVKCLFNNCLSENKHMDKLYNVSVGIHFDNYYYSQKAERERLYFTVTITDVDLEKVIETRSVMVRHNNGQSTIIHDILIGYPLYTDRRIYMALKLNR